MPKPAREFFPVESLLWSLLDEPQGAAERVLAYDSETGMLTRILRWDPGTDTSRTGVAVHDYVEEVLILSGSMHDLTLDRTFTAGDYACRPPGMPHGPWTSAEGCEMLEIRYAELR